MSELIRIPASSVTGNDQRSPQPAGPVAGTGHFQRRGGGAADRPPDGSGAPASDSASLDEMFSRLWRSKRSLIAGALAGVLIMLVVSVVSKPIYRARTSIRLDELNEKFPNLPEMLSVDQRAPGEVYLQNELKVLESDLLAKRVATQLGMQVSADPSSDFLSRKGFGHLAQWFHLNGPRPSRDDRLIRQVRDVLTIRSSLKSQVIDIFFDSADPDLAARGANAVVSEYIAMNREGRFETSQSNSEWITEQISDLKKKLDKGNEELQAFARSSGLLYGSNQSLLSEERARQVQEELTKARAERAAKQSRYESALSNAPEALPSAADSGLLRDYESKLAATQGELVQLRSLYTPAHYKVVEAEARAAQLESSVKAERQRIIARMRAEFDAAKRFEDSLESSYGAHARVLAQQTAAAFRYNVLKRDLDSTELLYNSLIQKGKEAGVTAAMSAISVRVIDPARPPASPRSPNLPLNSAIGLTSGLIFAAGLVLVRNRDAYRGVRNAPAGELELCELGTIPFARRIASPRRSSSLLAGDQYNARVELVTWYDQPSALTEAFRSAITSIVFSPAFDRQKNLILAVTSVQPQEGKTTAVSNLGIALAETHGRVLLIDADLRRPRIHEIFALCNDSGLSTVLTGEEPIATLKLDTLIRETNVPGLYTLPSGPGAPSIPPLLYSARMSVLLDRLRNEFDYVLIDTPPASLFSDARVLGRLSDGLVMVVHAAKVTRSELNATCANFVKDGTRIVGTIVNRASVRVRGYGSYKPTAA